MGSLTWGVLVAAADAAGGGAVVHVRRGDEGETRGTVALKVDARDAALRCGTEPRCVGLETQMAYTSRSVPHRTAACLHLAVRSALNN